MDEAAEEGSFERGDHGRAVCADRLTHLCAHLLAPGLEQVRGDVRASRDLARCEVRSELWVVYDDTDITERLCGLRHPLEHPLPRAVEALHVTDLHDLPRALSRLGDSVGVRERDAHRLLDEDVEAALERGECRRCMRLRRRADDNRVEVCVV